MKLAGLQFSKPYYKIFVIYELPKDRKKEIQAFLRGQQVAFNNEQSAKDALRTMPADIRKDCEVCECMDFI